MPIRQKVAKTKGVSDIIFCIDLSGSMTPCIEGVKEHVNTFVASLETGSPNMIIDWQLAFCGYNCANFYVSEFSNNARDFRRKVGRVDVEEWDEYTPGAIDFCINHFNWRPVANRFLIVFTDEEMMDGQEYDDTTSNFPSLLQEIEDNKIRLLFFGPKDKYYEQFGSVPRSMTNFISGSFDSVNFADLLSSLGKTVSQFSGSQGGGAPKRSGPVYDISGINVQNL